MLLASWGKEMSLLKVKTSVYWENLLRIMGFYPEGQIQGYECRIGGAGCWNSDLIKRMIQISTKAKVKDLECSPGLKGWSSVCKSYCSWTGLKIWRKLLVVLCEFWMRVLSCIHVLPCGKTSPCCLWDTSMAKRKNEEIRIGSVTSGQEDLPLSTLSHFPTNIFFHGSEGAQSPRWAVERTSIALVLRLPFAREQLRELVESADL